MLQLILNSLRFVSKFRFLKYHSFCLAYRGSVGLNGVSPTASSPVVDNTEAFQLSINQSVDGTLNSSGEVQLSIKCVEYVKCGTMFSSADILCGGKKEYHGKLGLYTKAMISLGDLEPINFLEGRRMSALYAQWVRTLNNTEEIPTLVLPLTPTKPTFTKALIHYCEYNPKKLTLHNIEVRDDVNVIGTKKISERYRKNAELSYTSTYDILADVKLESSEKTLHEETNLRVNFHWNGNEFLPFHRPPHSSKIVVDIQVSVGESRSPAHEIFLELTFLDSIVNTSSFQVTNLFNGSVTGDLLEKLQAFKKCVSDFSYYGVNQMNIEKEVSSEGIDELEKPMAQLIQQSFHRNDHDFTDKLWTFLRQSDSSDVMKAYLEEILHSIVNGDLQPAISPANETKLAKYIRKMYVAKSDEAKTNATEKILEFLSTDTSCLNLISEIGYEKLRKDYFNYFLKKELATASGLEEICKHTSGHFDITSLWKLHYCFELVTTALIYLTVSQSCQYTILKAALEYYSKHDIGASSPVFALSLIPFHDSSATIHQVCEGRQPVHWKQGTLSSNKSELKLTSVLDMHNKSVISDSVNEEFVPQHETVLAYEEVVPLPTRSIMLKVVQ